MHSIKRVKPKIYSKYKQGYINAQSCKKLFASEKNKPIIYRSSWEKKFILWCERCEKVKHWGSECIGIPYILPLDGNVHTYYPDFIVEMVDGTIIVVEIKPSNQVEQPLTENSYSMTAWIKNRAKWNAIVEICNTKNYKFCILTEKTINKL